MTTDTRLDDIIGGLLKALDLRAKSLLVTVWGDSIVPHGGSVGIGSLIELVRPLGLSERLVRTAIYRLTRDDWLVGRAIGRRSFYALTESGRRRFEDAHRRIYAPPRRAWDGTWHLIFANQPDLEAESRERLRRELVWRGFGQAAPGVFAHPSADPDEVAALLRELAVEDLVLPMRGSSRLLGQQEPLRRLVRNAWDIARLERDYRGFLEHFQPLLQVLRDGAAPGPEACFMIRSLLIHDYRRVLLRDPLLPDELLAQDWPGAAARALCRDLYRMIQTGTERHLAAVLRTAEGPLPAVAPGYWTRFGGLRTEAAA